MVNPETGRSFVSALCDWRKEPIESIILLKSKFLPNPSQNRVAVMEAVLGVLALGPKVSPSCENAGLPKSIQPTPHLATGLVTLRALLGESDQTHLEPHMLLASLG